jgi:Fur family peroxide stress response transcriptional regulator
VTIKTPDPLARALREHGLRRTPQRLAIARAVAGNDRHPTVQDVHAMVREEFPTMSLATVYNTLRSLVGAGVIADLPFAGGARFDSDPSPHINLVCSDCGSIVDAHEYDQLLSRLTRSVSGRPDFRVDGHRFDFYGRCASCARDTAQPAP